MTGTTADIIPIVIVPVVILVFWLVTIYYANSHPRWGSQAPAAPVSTHALEESVPAQRLSSPGTVVPGQRPGTAADQVTPEQAGQRDPKLALCLKTSCGEHYLSQAFGRLLLSPIRAVVSILPAEVPERCPAGGPGGRVPRTGTRCSSLARRLPLLLVWRSRRPVELPGLRALGALQPNFQQADALESLAALLAEDGRTRESRRTYGRAAQVFKAIDDAEASSRCDALAAP